MFIQNLTLDQQSVLLDLSNQLIAADGVLSDDELVFIETLKSQMMPNIEDHSATYNQLSDVFSDKASKASLLLELLGVAHADDEYQDEEKTFMNNIATQLNVSQNELSEMEDWVIAQLNLSKQAIKFMLEV